jgi:hypothetical protein
MNPPLPPSPKDTNRITQPTFIIGVYRTFPLKPLELLPIPKWNNPYAHIKSKVKSYNINESKQTKNDTSKKESI